MGFWEHEGRNSEYIETIGVCGSCGKKVDIGAYNLCKKCRDEFKKDNDAQMDKITEAIKNNKDYEFVAGLLIKV